MRRSFDLFEQGANRWNRECGETKALTGERQEVATFSDCLHIGSPPLMNSTNGTFGESFLQKQKSAAKSHQLPLVVFIGHLVLSTLFLKNNLAVDHGHHATSLKNIQL